MIVQKRDAFVRRAFQWFPGKELPFWLQIDTEYWKGDEDLLEKILVCHEVIAVTRGPFYGDGIHLIPGEWVVTEPRLSTLPGAEKLVKYSDKKFHEKYKQIAGC